MRSFIVMVQRGRCDHLVDILLIGWWLGYWESASSTFWFQSVWGLHAYGQHTVISSTQWRGFSICKTVQRYCYMYPLRGYQEPSPRLPLFLVCFLQSLHLLIFLISNCLNLPFGTQGRSWRLNKSISYKQETERGDRNLLCPGAPQGPTWFRKQNPLSLSGLSRTYVTQPQPTFLTLNPSSSIPYVHTKLSQTQNLHILLPFMCSPLWVLVQLFYLHQHLHCHVL